MYYSTLSVKDLKPGFICDVHKGVVEQNSVEFFMKLVKIDGVVRPAEHSICRACLKKAKGEQQ